MKYALISIAAIVLAVAISILIVLLINKKHKMKGWLKGIIIPVSSIVLIISFILVYFAFNYRATDRAKSYLKGDEVINLESINIGIILIIKKMMTLQSSSIVARKLIQSPIPNYVTRLRILE